MYLKTNIVKEPNCRYEFILPLYNTHIKSNIAFKIYIGNMNFDEIKKYEINVFKKFIVPISLTNRVERD